MDRYLCVIAELDEETQHSLKMYEELILENGFRDRKAKGLPYHITLNTYSVEYEGYLKELLDVVKVNCKQINVVFTSFGLFGLNVIYLNPAMNRALMELYDTAKEYSNSEYSVFAAHTTLFIGDPENTLKLLPEFVRIAKKTAGNLKYVSLYEFPSAILIKRVELLEE